MNVEEILNERGSVHGPWSVQSGITQKIKEVMFDAKGYAALSRSQRDALEMIATKMGRILAGDPNHQDHWDDIAGYATLASKEIARVKP